MTTHAAGSMADMNPKPVKYRNKKVLEAARYMDCSYCGADDNTIVMAHSNHHDKGGATKSSDCFIAALCFACHEIVDGRRLPNLKQSTRDTLWLTAHKNTIGRLMMMRLISPQALELLQKAGSLSASPSPT